MRKRNSRLGPMLAGLLCVGLMICPITRSWTSSPDSSESPEKIERNRVGLGFLVLKEGEPSPGKGLFLTPSQYRLLFKRLATLEEDKKDLEAELEYEKRRRELAQLSYQKFRILGFVDLDTDWGSSMAGAGLQYYPSKHIFFEGRYGADIDGDTRALFGIGIAFP